MNLASDFKQTVLYTGDDGRAQFKEQAIAFTQGTPQSALTQLDRKSVV